MVNVSYTFAFILISVLWVIVRSYFCIKLKKIDWKRELQLLLVYICLVVVVRFTFFPFGKVDGRIQPLVFDISNAFKFRINFVPLVNLFDYPELKDVLINVIGNTTMFIPIGIVWPIVYKELDSHIKVLSAGIGLSLFIEIVQLPFYDRVSDIDDLILNSVGFLSGYLIYLLVKRHGKRKLDSRK